MKKANIKKSKFLSARSQQNKWRNCECCWKDGKNFIAITSINVFLIVSSNEKREREEQNINKKKII